MKELFVAFVLFFVTLSAGNLTCRYSIDNGAETNSTCPSSDGLCAKFEGTNEVNVDDDTPMIFKGCSSALENSVLAIKCHDTGNFKINSIQGSSIINGYLYCCNTDNCNSAAPNSIFTVIASLTILKIFI